MSPSGPRKGTHATHRVRSSFLCGRPIHFAGRHACRRKSLLKPPQRTSSPSHAGGWLVGPGVWASVRASRSPLLQFFVERRAGSSMCAPLLFGWGDRNCELLGRLPAAVGEGWRSFGSGCDSGVAAGWGPAVVELALVLAPAVALAMVIGSGVVASSR